MTTISCSRLKAIGGVYPLFGVQNDVEFILKYFSLGSQRFLRNLKIFFLAQDIRVRRRPGMTEIALFPIYFPYKKWGQKGLKSWFFQPKMTFRHVFWCYFMEIHVLDHLKPKKLPYFQDFGRFWPNRGHFFRKMGPEA